MVASGLLDTASRHAEAVTNMAFDMRADASKVMEPVHNQPLQVQTQCITFANYFNKIFILLIVLDSYWNSHWSSCGWSCRHQDA